MDGFGEVALALLVYDVFPRVVPIEITNGLLENRDHVVEGRWPGIIAPARLEASTNGEVRTVAKGKLRLNTGHQPSPHAYSVEHPPHPSNTPRKITENLASRIPL